jgi:hypothetical protein
MIRKVVEANAPPGTVPDDNIGQGPVKEAQALIEGILAIAKSSGRVGVATPRNQLQSQGLIRLRAAPVHPTAPTKPGASAILEDLPYS